MKKFLLLLNALIWINTFVAAQDLQQRYFLEQNMVLLINRDSLVPFKRLDTINFSLETYSKKFQPFIKAFSRYARIKPSDNRANLFIYALDSGTTANITKKPAIVIIFGNDYNLIDSVAASADVLLLVPRQDSLAQDYAAQLLMGAIPAQGHLPVATKIFPAQSGITTHCGIRLKYTIPQELGLDSAYIYSRVDSIARLGIRVHAYPGCQILAAVNGKVIFYKSYGYHTYDSLLPVQMSDLYDLASVTKIAASAPCLMLLYDHGLLQLNRTLGYYLPQMRWSNKNHVKLIDAFTHQARLTPWIPFWKKTVNRHGQLKKKYFSTDSSAKYPYRVAENLYASKKARKLVLRLIRRSKLLPEKKYRYSDLSFYLVPMIVQRLTGLSFTQCLEKNFYNPLGAWRMGFNPYQRFALTQIIPTEYDSLFRKQQILGTVHDEGAAMIGGISGHAGLFANADDLAKLMQMYLNYGTYGGRRYLSDTTVKRWTSYQFADQGNRRGIVFDKPLLDFPERGTPSTLASPESFGHSGFTGTFTWADPQTGLLFIFLSNRVYPTRKNKNLIHYNIRTQIHSIFYEAILKAQENETSDNN